MSPTPDRHPGTLEEERLRLTYDEGKTADVPGDIVFTGTDFSMKDAVGVFNPRSGGGISEAEHELLDTLTHEIDETSYDEVTYDGNDVSTYVVWETAAKLKKVREEIYTYGTGHRVTQVVTKQYDVAGALKMTMTEAFTYSGNKISAVTRTKS